MRWVNSPVRSYSIDYPVDEDCDRWRVLGWRLPSGELRHGDYDVLDPELADFDRLPVPDSKRIPDTSAQEAIGRCAAVQTQ